MKLLAAVALATSLIATAATAQSFRPVPAVTTALPNGDDTTFLVTLPFPIKMGAEGATDQWQLSMNALLLTPVTGSDLTPYFSDLETRADTGQANYGSSAVGGRPAFIATYDNVGYSGVINSDRANVQLVVIDRSDLAAGDFDFEINTQGLVVPDAADDFYVDGIAIGRAGVAPFPAGAGAYRSVWTFRNGVLTSGTGPTLIAPPAAVPTLSEWAMVFFGALLAGGAALYIQRRRPTA